MAVAFDAIGTMKLDGTGTATNVTDASLTVGAGSNRALTVWIGFGSALVTGVSATWDSGGSNQAMTQIGSDLLVVGAGLFQLWGLVNPVSGAKTLSVSWTTGSRIALIDASWTGVNQTGGATSFPNFTSSGSNSVSVTSGANDAIIGNFGFSGSESVINQTQAYVDNSIVGCAGNYAVGTGTTSMTVTASGTVGAMGASILSAGGSSFKPYWANQNNTGVIGTGAY